MRDPDFLHVMVNTCLCVFVCVCMCLRACVCMCIGMHMHAYICSNHLVQTYTVPRGDNNLLYTFPPVPHHSDFFPHRK